jgi:hypothetical protein
MARNLTSKLKANTIQRPTVAVQLVLDQSGSMAWAAGTSGATRLEVLKDAASLFASLIQKNNGIGIIRFDQDAYPPNDPTYGGMAITKVLNDGFGDPTRIAAAGVIAQLTAPTAIPLWETAWRRAVLRQHAFAVKPKDGRRGHAVWVRTGRFALSTRLAY